MVSKKIGKNEWIIEVVSYAGDEVVHTVPGGKSVGRANRIDDGMQRNLDHERYFTRLVSPEERAKRVKAS